MSREPRLFTESVCRKMEECRGRCALSVCVVCLFV